MNKHTALSRRTFLKLSTTAAGSLALPAWMPSAARAAESSPNARVTVAIIGRGAMGSGHVRSLAGDPEFQVIGVCDVDQAGGEAGQSYVNEFYAADRSKGTYKGCAAYNDYRELLARPDLD